MEQDDPFRIEEAGSGSESNALSIFSLVLGILSIPGALVVGLGILPGLFGLVVGILAGRRAKWGSPMAIMGIAFSLLGMLMSAAVIGLVVWGFTQVPVMAGRLEEQQLAANQAWEGVIAPDHTLVDADGTEFSIRERADRKLVLIPFFPMDIPMFEDGTDVTVTINELADLAAGDFEVVAITPMPPADVQTMVSSAGLTPLTAPVANSQMLPPPFMFTGFGSCYFVIDRNGVIQRVLGGDTPVEEIIDAAMGPDFEGEPAQEPDYSGMDNIFYNSTTQGNWEILP